MSLALLKRTVPKESNEENDLPIKRVRSFTERYNQLIQDEIDGKLLRKEKKPRKKEKKEKIETKKNNSKSLLEKIEEKLSKEKYENRLEKNLEILKNRTLPMKYIELLSKKQKN